MRIALVCVAVWASLTAPAVARDLTVRDVGPATSAFVDGDVIAADSGASVTLRDAAGRVTRTVATPAGCRLVDFAASTLLWSCPQAGQTLAGARTFDLSTGIAATIPPPSAPYGSAPDSGGYEAIGRRWLAVGVSGYHYAGTFAYRDRVTGRQVDAAQRDDRHLSPDLDTARLDVPLCTGIVRPLVADEAFFGTEPGPLALRGRRAAASTTLDEATGRQRVLYQRCGRQPRVLATCFVASPCSQPVIGPRSIAWTRAASDSPPRLARLSVASRRGGPTRSIPTRVQLVVVGLVADDLYVIDGDGHLLRVST